MDLAKGVDSHKWRRGGNVILLQLELESNIDEVDVG